MGIHTETNVRGPGPDKFLQMPNRGVKTITCESFGQSQVAITA